MTLKKNSLYRSICSNIYFMKLLKRKKRILALWNAEWVSLFVKQLKFYGMNPNISKCWLFVLLDTRSNMTSKYSTNYLLLRQSYKWEDCRNICWWIGWYPPSRLNNAETSSNNSGRYTLLKSHITWNNYCCWLL